MNPLNIVSGAPVWVWPLLALMVALGLRATRDREAPIWTYRLLPLFAALPISGLAEGPAPALAWPVFAAAYLAGAVWGAGAQRRFILSRGRSNIRVRGEWLTLATLMGVFWMNFARGATEALAPDALTSTPGVASLAVVSGVLSGQFAGRSIRVLLTPVSDRPAPA